MCGPQASFPTGRVGTSRRLCTVLALLLPGLAGCGLGTAAVVGSSGSAGGSNAAPAMSAFVITDPKTPAVDGAPPMPSCTIHFVLSDAEGDAATVEFFYRVPGESPVSMAHLGLPANPTHLPATSTGTLHSIPWDFAAEDLLPDDASFMAGVTVYARVHGTPNAITPGANAQILGLGNDPPVITADNPPAEVDSVVPVRLHMSDSSSDVLDIRVEYDIVGDEPDAGWRTARPAGLLSGTATPVYAFSGIAADSQGSDIVFFWDTDFDLQDLERDVQLRVTPIDPVVAGTPAVTNVFRVDNNAAPILQLLEGAFISNLDTVRGIPLPFTVIDEESDEITVVLQWRREGGAFPQLPSTPAQIEAILADGDLRQQYHVCTEYPRPAEGWAIQLDTTRVRLPELSGEQSFLVQAGLVGRDLEILRPTGTLNAVSTAWASNSLVRPVTALPLDGGTHALVLDEDTRGTWRLVEVRLLDGVIERTVATGSGEPSAACFERDEATVLIASSAGTAWQVTRVKLANGASSYLADVTDGPVERGLVRGIASIGTNAAVLTVGSSLVRVDWSATLPSRALVVREDLATPWGVVVDPRNAGWVLVAENSAPRMAAPGRVVAVELATRAMRPVVILPNADDGLAFARPRGIAMLRKGTRLLAVCETDPLSGRVELRSVDLGRGDASSAVPLGQPLGAGAAALEAGSTDDLLVSTSGRDRRVLAAGGVERRATIAAVDPNAATVTLASPLDPALDPASRWRIALSGDGTVRVAPDPQGLTQTFLWNSGDVPGGGNAFLRGTPLDADIGMVSSFTGPKPVSPTFRRDQQIVDSGDNPRCVVTADLDGDGDLDLVSGNTCNFIAPPCDDSLKVFWQTAPGEFELDPITLGGSTVADGPASLVAADLDGDGDLDLVSANQNDNTLTIFWMIATGVFDSTPTTLVVPGPIVGPEVHYPYFVVQAADLDGDGDLDLVCTNEGSDQLAVFRQTAPGVFGPTPTFLGGPGVTPSPIDVEAADLDADGDIDLVSANYHGGTLTVFWQNALGSFDPFPTTLSVPTNSWGPPSVEAADLDGDGDLDLVCASGDSSLLAIFWQTDPGVFDPNATTIGGIVSSAGASFVQAADLDGDGDLDLVSGNISVENLTVFWQAAPGVFDPIPTVIGGVGITSGIDARVADLDGDGDLDLLSLNSGVQNNTFGIFWQTDPGEFDAAPTELAGLVGDINYTLDVQAADLDGDGDLDLVSANLLSETLTVYWQTTSGTFESSPTVLRGTSTTLSPDSVQAADLDGDSDLDLVCANGGGNNLTVFWQTDPGVFDSAPTTTVGGPASTPAPFSVLAADIDGDGRVDLVSANNGNSTLSVFWQGEGGSFQSLTSLGDGSTTSGLRFVQAADLDGDGDLDLVSANRVTDNLKIFLQKDEPRTFEAATLVGGPSASNGPWRVEAADLDGDGDLDLVSANFDGNDLSVFWQTGSGTFDPTPTKLGGFSTTNDVFAVQAADLDGDGDLDLVSANLSGNTLTLFWQLAPGQFDPTPTVIDMPGDSAQPSCVQAVDTDADGDLELVVGSRAFRLLWVFRRLH